MGFFSSFFGSDKSQQNTTTTNTQTTVNTTTSDSYNTALTQNLSRNDSFVNAPVTNTALDFVNTYNLANTGNIYGEESGSLARFAANFDLNAFFAATRPTTPNSSAFDWGAGGKTAGGILDKVKGVLEGQAGQTAAAGQLGNQSNRLVLWIVLAGLGVIALFFFLRRK